LTPFNPAVPQLIFLGHQPIFKTDFTPARSPLPFRSNNDEPTMQRIHNEHHSLLELGVLVPCASRAATTFSNWFPVIKPNKIRFVLDCDIINKSIVNPPHFKHDTIQITQKHILPGDFMVKIDITHAYYHIPISHTGQAFFGLTGPNGRLYRLAAAPMGYKASAHLLHILLMPLLSLLHKAGMRFFLYCDDIFGINQDEHLLRRQTLFAVQLLKGCGFLVNLSKCILEPTQRASHLGFSIDTQLFRISVDTERVSTLRRLAERALQLYWKRRLTLRQLAQLTGIIISFCPANPNLLLVAQPMIRAVRWLRKHCHDWPSPLGRLPDSTFNSIKFLRGHRLSTICHGPINLNHRPDWILTTDASDVAGAGVLSFFHDSADAPITTASCCRPWSDGRPSPLHINELEAWAIANCHHLLNLPSRVPPNSHLLVETDNQTLLYYLRKRGGRHSHLASPLYDFLNWLLLSNIHLSTQYVNSTLNRSADALSRLATPPTISIATDMTPHEWQTSLDTRAIILSYKPTIDIFATHKNTVCKLFRSRFPPPNSHCYTPEAILSTWRNHIVLAVPPTPLIASTISKHRQPYTQHKALILFVPYWPNQIWFADLWDIIRSTTGALYHLLNSNAIHHPFPLRPDGRWRAEACTRHWLLVYLPNPNWASDYTARLD